MGQKEKKKMLTKSTYEGLCRKACASPEKPEAGETVEDAYWRAIYREVSRYLSPASPVAFQPIGNVPLKNKYQFNLGRVVMDNSERDFDPIDVATKFVNDAVGKEEE
jgi:hypothetical protein